MAVVIPDSWRNNPYKIEDWMAINARVPIPANETIYMTEYTDVEGSSLAAFRINTFSAASMRFWTLARTFNDPALRHCLTRNIIGGHVPLANFAVDGSATKIKPMPHPFIPNLWAKNINGPQFISPDDDAGNAGIFDKYQYALFSIDFESLPYSFNKPPVVSGDTGYSPNWMEVKMRSTNNRVSTPVGWYVVRNPGGDFDNFPAGLGNWLTCPTAYIEITIYQVPRIVACGTGGAVGPSDLKFRFSNRLGQVNVFAFAGCDAETMMLDSVEMYQYFDWEGNDLVTIKLVLMYNEWGWNAQPAPDNVIRDIRFVTSGAKPRPTFDMLGMLNYLNEIV